MAETSEPGEKSVVTSDVNASGNPKEKASLFATATSAVFATVLAPVLVALGMKLVDRISLSESTEPASKHASTAKQSDSKNALEVEPPATNQDTGSTSSRIAPSPLSPPDSEEIPLTRDWTFHPLEAGAVDRKRFLFHADGTISVSTAGPKGILLWPGEFQNFQLSFGWRYPPGSKNKGTMESGVLIRSDLDHWPDNRLEVALAAGHVGSFRVGANISITSGEPEHPIIKNPSDWHTLEILCQGDSVTVSHNGIHVNSGTALSRTRGRVGLMVETRDIEFRDFQLKALANSR